MSVIKIDGIGINAEHFKSMKKADAVTSMIANGFVPGETDKDKKSWAAKAWDLMNPSIEKHSPETEAPEGEEA